ncbi:cadmium resistance transporter, partial [Corynebacterium marquesiae]|uniref:cadmium resistance transporter n=1 Tax=Corynebacterium marquesiae TaxID=2913503 RepID=UPI0030C9F70F
RNRVLSHPAHQHRAVKEAELNPGRFTTPAEVAIYCVVFLILVEPLVWAARFVATRPGIAEALEKWESVLFPVVLILLGIAILLAV